MVMANTERIQKALDLLRDGLAPKCEETWQGFYGDDWLQQVNQQFHHPERDPNPNDIAFVFKGVKVTWNEVFGHGFAPAIRSLVFEVAEVRNNWAHQGSFSSDDTSRALDSMERVLEAFGNSTQRQAIRALRRDLMRQVFEEEARGERRKTAAKPTEGRPAAGLTPWRSIIAPHPDVAAGRFDQAEFAADLSEVAAGTADHEYQHPRAFFARTYLTEGLRALLVGAARRLSGGDGDPVIELQTNFGGGKTHSMIALYHLASGVPAEELPGISEALAAEQVTLPPKISRAVLVGQMISASEPEPAEDGVTLHTLWGQLAHQLGGKAGYELVRSADETGTNPGAALKKLFTQCGPAVVLIDEWIAYARQLREPGDGKRLPGGDFDTQFTFAQALTEAASAATDVVVLVAIPASDIEVGGDRGRTALAKLKNVVTRKAAQWQPASPDESFEIVRRRLFDPVPDDKARVRDSVVHAFAEMYRKNKADFPSECSEADYRRRIERSYPIHPELFDRLFGDWSTLEKFQRTRGVLRLMAVAISELWQSNDQSLLIMPGNLPMASGALVSEMKKYLDEGWDPVIKTDVDGENALPPRVDAANPHLGRLSAARRVARTVYMGSAAKPEHTRGIDAKRIMLGCVQPGEQAGQFKGALDRLKDQATHLYVDGAQCWYGLQPTVNRLARDRADNYGDYEADLEARERIGRQSGRGEFAAVQVFAAGPGDVPDNDDGVRLVILTPDVTHSARDENSSACELAAEILAQRHGGPRQNQNLLVFSAAEVNRVSELRDAARSYLAWRSIVGDDTMEMTKHQQRQAQTRLAETDQQVDSLIAETFVHVLSPHKEAGTSEIVWHATKVPPTTDDELAAKVSKKLVSEDKLIPAYGGVRMRMDLDGHNGAPLWSERGDITVGELWNIYARLPYMPRLSSFAALADAVKEGPAAINWAQETFGYAEAHDGDTWVGVTAGANVGSVTASGFVVRPDCIPQPESDGPEGGGGSGQDAEGTVGDGDENAAGEGTADAGSDGSAAPLPTRYYAHFNLDALRWIKDVGDIKDHILEHLGPDVEELSLEIRVAKADGYDDATRRTVSENAANLGARTSEFE